MQYMSHTHITHLKSNDVTGMCLLFEMGNWGSAIKDSVPERICPVRLLIRGRFVEHRAEAVPGCVPEGVPLLEAQPSLPPQALSPGHEVECRRRDDEGEGERRPEVGVEGLHQGQDFGQGLRQRGHERHEVL